MANEGDWLIFFMLIAVIIGIFIYELLELLKEMKRKGISD